MPSPETAPTSSTSAPPAIDASIVLAESVVSSDVTEVPFQVVNREPARLVWGVRMDIEQFVDDRWEHRNIVTAGFGYIPPDPDPQGIIHIGIHAHAERPKVAGLLAQPPLEPGRYRVSLDVRQPDYEDSTEDPRRTIFDELEVVPR